MNALIRVVVVWVILAGSTAALVADPVILQSTTSTRDSGILDYLLSRFTARSGIPIRAVAVGTGQALNNARKGDGDVLLVHARAAEEQFVAAGYGVRRYNLMYNDFIIVGPSLDPAAAGDADNVLKVLHKIASSTALFISRGDESGTHQKELALWAEAGLEPNIASGTWYRETGSGMGATLNVASGINAYTMVDRATWLTFGNKSDLQIVHQGDRRLFNQYGITLINPSKHPHVNAESGQALIDWLLSADGQNAIAAYKYHGQQLFFPNADGHSPSSKDR